MFSLLLVIAGIAFCFHSDVQGEFQMPHITFFNEKSTVSSSTPILAPDLFLAMFSTNSGVCKGEHRLWVFTFQCTTHMPSNASKPSNHYHQHSSLDVVLDQFCMPFGLKERTIQVGESGVLHLFELDMQRLLYLEHHQMVACWPY